MNIQILLIISLLCSVFGFSSQEKPLLKIPQGILQGTILLTRNGRNFSAFQGIPYAQPPIKELRFSSPVPAKAWDNVYLANKNGNSCPQILPSSNDIIGEEDCLYLNVFSPLLNFKSKTNGTLLPVMVWIQGGAFMYGNTSFTGPNYLLDKDVILVTFHYRLGIFGFLTTGDSVAPGNFAFKDQVLALKWVQENIKSFGGDPERVTLFGQSAGGAFVHYHTLSNASNGLFHQYILQSGVAVSPWAFRKRDDYKPFVNNVANIVGCSNSSSTVLIKCLRETSVNKLLKSAIHIAENFPEIPWLPTDELESEDAFLTESPQDLLVRNKMKDYPFMSGTVLHEGIIVTNKLNQSSYTFEAVRDYLDKCIDKISKYYLPAKDLSKFKTLIYDYYFNKSYISANKYELLNSYNQFVTDSGFFYPELLVLENRAKVAKSPFYLYSFIYQSSNTTAIVPHSAELPYLFSKNNTHPISDKDERVIDIMVDLWTSFAINGKPTTIHLEHPNMWLPYTDNNSYYLQFSNLANHADPVVTLENDYFTNRMNFWKGIVSS